MHVCSHGSYLGSVCSFLFSQIKLILLLLLLVLLLLLLLLLLLVLLLLIFINIIVIITIITIIIISNIIIIIITIITFITIIIIIIVITTIQLFMFRISFGLIYRGSSLHKIAFHAAIKSLASEEQKAVWLPMIEKGLMYGSYAQTEIGHGMFALIVGCFVYILKLLNL